MLMTHRMRPIASPAQPGDAEPPRCSRCAGSGRAHEDEESELRPSPGAGLGCWAAGCRLRQWIRIKTECGRWQNWLAARVTYTYLVAFVLFRPWVLQPSAWNPASSRPAPCLCLGLRPLQLSPPVLPPARPLARPSHFHHAVHLCHHQLRARRPPVQPRPIPPNDRHDAFRCRFIECPDPRRCSRLSPFFDRQVSTRRIPPVERPSRPASR
jgi:hypothetical protein